MACADAYVVVTSTYTSVQYIGPLRLLFIFIENTVRPGPVTCSVTNFIVAERQTRDKKIGRVAQAQLNVVPLNACGGDGGRGRGISMVRGRQRSVTRKVGIV